MRMGTMEILVVLAVVLIIFGPKQIPKLAKMFGKATKSFKEGVENAEVDEDKAEAAPAEKKEEEKTEDKAE